MKETLWLYPGSFDPVTYGHINIIERAARQCGKLVVAVMDNYEKCSLFSTIERVNMIRKAAEGLDNVEVVSFSGLQADLYTELKADAVVRGIRNNADYDYELFLARGIQLLVPDYEVVFLATDIRYCSINSSSVRALGAYGGKLSPFVPDFVEEKVREKFKEKHNGRNQD